MSLNAICNFTANAVTTSGSGTLYAAAGSLCTIALQSAGTAYRGSVDIDCGTIPEAGSSHRLAGAGWNASFNLPDADVSLNVSVTVADINGATASSEFTLVVVRSGQLPVQHWGAAGDGTTDDTTAIQTATNALAGTGFTLLFPAGTYVVSGSPSIPANTQISASASASFTGAGGTAFATAITATSGSTAGTITNLDPTSPDLVRFASRATATALAGAAETTGYYARLDHGTLGNIATYGLYVEVDPLQNYTSGGCAIKVLHAGHGDGCYVGLVSKSFEAATITAMTGNGVSPIVCTVPGHGYGQGDIVTIAGCTGNTAANGTWYGITVIDANTFSLPNSTGNGAYNASSGTAQDIDSPVGYEAAAFRDGTVGFLSSMQKAGGCASWQGFEALYSQNQTLTYGAFVANDLPNNAFKAVKRTGLADSAIDGNPQFSVIESLYRLTGGDGGGGSYKGGWSSSTAYVDNDTVTLSGVDYICILGNTNEQPPNATYWTNVSDTTNFGRIRCGIYNSGEVDQNSLLATSASTLHDSPIHRYNGSYWSGSAGVVRTAYWVHHLLATTPQSDFRLYMGAVGSESVRLIIADTAPLWYRVAAQGTVDTQSGTSYDEICYLKTTAAAAASVDTAYKPPAGHSATVRVIWNVRDTSNGNTAGAETMAVIRNVAGTLTVAGAGAGTSTFGDSAVNTSAIGFTVSGTNTFEIQGTPPGSYSGTLDWQFRLEIIEN